MGGIIQALACDGARVLCPNFPGYGPTPMDEDMAYSHSLIENCNFLLDFLVKLGVMKVDLIVAFSAGGYPAVPLAIKSEYPVGGLALIQLPGHRVGRVMRPFWLKKALIRAMTRKWVRRLLTPINQLVMRNDGWKAIQSIEHTYIMGLTGIGVPFDNYEKVSAELPFSQLPLLLTFSEDDKFIDASIAYDYAEVVGVPRDHLTVYNREGQIVHRGRPVVNDTQYVRGMVFQKGGHFAQTRQPFAAVIEDAVVDIYRHIQRRKEREGIMTVRAEREA
ncbi:uncharacterized protein LOC129584359 isoform X2 [Paramacrobiotus metropolitanus]|nr:uncharacterized protein LOC129584359 isoform X2 [Paramacrobiotus metropolitanus]